jgi:hypothetical protein
MSKYKGVFKDWKIEYYRASHEGKSLWICNGFQFFKDEKLKTFLSHLSFFQRYRLWRELKREIRERAQKEITNLINKTPQEG